MVAGGSAALVLFLATLAASPDLHARFHDAALSGNEEGCAVALFASGVSLAAEPVVVAAPAIVRLGQEVLLPGKLFLVVSRYLHQPERGPPVG